MAGAQSRPMPRWGSFSPPKRRTFANGIAGAASPAPRPIACGAISQTAWRAPSSPAPLPAWEAPSQNGLAEAVKPRPLLFRVGRSFPHGIAGAVKSRPTPHKGGSSVRRLGGSRKTPSSRAWRGVLFSAYGMAGAASPAPSPATGCHIYSPLCSARGILPRAVS